MPIIRTGSGYADDTNFDDYDVIAEPLPDREDRVFVERGRAVTYDAFSIRLGRHKNGGDRGGFAIMVLHGGGSELVSLTTIYDDQATIAQVLLLPERALYGLLWSIWSTAKTADELARQETRAQWSQAFVNSRIRKSRANGSGFRKVWIEPGPLAQVSAGPLL